MTDKIYNDMPWQDQANIGLCKARHYGLLMLWYGENLAYRSEILLKQIEEVRAQLGGWITNGEE